MKELRCWHTGYYNKPTLFLGGNHCSKISAVDISQIINPFHFYAYFFSLTFRKVKPSRLSHSFVFNFPLLLMSRKETDLDYLLYRVHLGRWYVDNHRIVQWQIIEKCMSPMQRLYGKSSDADTQAIITSLPCS
jgi:hypothetical protein